MPPLNNPCTLSCKLSTISDKSTLRVKALPASSWNISIPDVVASVSKAFTLSSILSFVTNRFVEPSTILSELNSLKSIDNVKALLASS